ncbi:MAG: TonB-dependent receptor [Hyphomonadaceae bacterium]
MKFASCLLGGVSIWAALAAPVAAQQTSEESNAVGEVVVTALKRDETIQEVPATISVIGADQLEDLNITTISALREVVGGLQLRQSANGTPELKIRGLGTSTSVMSFEQSVGAFVDGAYLGHGRVFQSSMFDIERVELVRGTQAALLGKNTSLGAISLVTRRPGRDFSYNILGSYEFELESDLISGGVDIPVTDEFRLRIAAQRDHRGGWVHNVMTGHDGPDIVDFGGRVTAVWEPTDNFDATLSYMYTNRERVGMPIEGVRDWADYPINPALWPLGAAGYPGDTVFDYQTDYNSWFGEGTEENTGHLAILTGNYRFANGVTFTSQTSFLNFDMDQNETSTFTYYNAWDSGIGETEEQISQEFRLASPGDQFLDYLVGVYFSRDEWGQTLDYRAYGDTANGGYNGANPPPPPDPSVADVQPPITARMLDSHQYTTDTAALFGVVTINPTDALSIDLSARVTNESRELEYSRYFPVGTLVTQGAGATQSPFTDCLGGGATAIGGNSPTCVNRGGGFEGVGLRSVDGTHTDGSIAVTYELTDAVRAYASWGQGTKGAGFSNQDGIPGAPYGVETARTTEVGVKTTFDDLRFNLAVFSTEIDALQTAVFTGGFFVTSNRNVRSQGADIELDWQPLENLRVGLLATYAEVENLNSPGDPSLQAGTPVSGAPLWSGVLRADWRHEVFDNYELSVQPSLNFRSSVNMREYTRGLTNCLSDPTVFAYSCLYPRSDAYNKLNLRVGLESLDNGWEIALVGNNITDEAVLGYAYPQGNGTTQTTVEPPRTIALQFSLRN